LTEYETVRISSTYTITMRMPCIGWCIVQRLASDVDHSSESEERV
jgi:hypothetical protein